MTRRFPSLLLLALTGWLASSGGLRADPTNPAPDFREIYELLRAHLPGATDASLNRAAVAGLVSQFPDKVVLVGASAGAAARAGGTALDQVAVIENNVAYFRVSRVNEVLAGELSAAGRALTATNSAAGAVLDLRFAGGDDYTAAQETARSWSGPRGSRPVAGPLVVLMNGQTRGAAEALVAALREANTALSIGSPTAGAAMTFSEFALKDGDRLLIATTPVKVAGKAMPADGLKPDIAVTVKTDEERSFWENPYGTSVPDTNRVGLVTNNFLPFVDHTSEADLVRQKQKDARQINLPPPLRPSRGSFRPADDGNDDDTAPSRAARPSAPVLRDPVLARAVDLVKGLAALRAARP